MTTAPDLDRIFADMLATNPEAKRLFGKLRGSVNFFLGEMYRTAPGAKQFDPALAKRIVIERLFP